MGVAPRAPGYTLAWAGLVSSLLPGQQLPTRDDSGPPPQGLWQRLGTVEVVTTARVLSVLVC